MDKQSKKTIVKKNIILLKRNSILSLFENKKNINIMLKKIMVIFSIPVPITDAIMLK